MSVGTSNSAGSKKSTGTSNSGKSLMNMSVGTSNSAGSKKSTGTSVSGKSLMNMSVGTSNSAGSKKSDGTSVSGKSLVNIRDRRERKGREGRLMVLLDSDCNDGKTPSGKKCKNTETNSLMQLKAHAKAEKIMNKKNMFLY